MGVRAFSFTREPFFSLHTLCIYPSSAHGLDSAKPTCLFTLFSPPDRSWLPCRKTGGNAGPGTQRGHLHPHAQPLLHGADEAAVKLRLRQHPQGRRNPHAGEGHVGHAHGQAAPVRRQLRPAAGGSRQAG